jgi:uncharacterized protein YmfQ (DUF2313 family)
MENNKLQEIYDRLTTDQAFAEELKKFAEGKEISTPEESAAAFIEFAKLQGYDITIDELKAFAEDQSKALSEEELDSVNAAGIVSWITNAVLKKLATFEEDNKENIRKALKKLRTTFY